MWPHATSGIAARARVSIWAFVQSILISVAAGAAEQAKELSQPPQPQPLAEALLKFADDTGLQLLYRAGLVTNIYSAGAPTGGTPEEKLRALLYGTGLTYAFVNERVLTILQEEIAIDPDLPGPQPLDMEVIVQSWRD